MTSFPTFYPLYIFFGLTAMVEPPIRNDTRSPFPVFYFNENDRSENHEQSYKYDFVLTPNDSNMYQVTETYTDITENNSHKPTSNPKITFITREKLDFYLNQLYTGEIKSFGDEPNNSITIFKPSPELEGKITKANLDTINKKIIEANPILFKTGKQEVLPAEPNEQKYSESSNQKIVTELNGEELIIKISLHSWLQDIRDDSVPPEVGPKKIITNIAEMDVFITYTYNLKTPHFEGNINITNMKSIMDGVVQEVPPGTPNEMNEQFGTRNLTAQELKALLDQLYTTGKNKDIPLTSTTY